MSKNITISEGAQAKNFNSVSKLRTNLIGGGTQDWVPEDEAGLYANLGIAEIDKNGTYKAVDERLDGFSEVAVQVKPKVTTLNVSQNGTYRAKKDKVDGYDVVEVQVPSEGGGGHSTLITKEITDNGTYNAEDEDADGYSSVTVNVDKGINIQGTEIQATAITSLSAGATVYVQKSSAQPTQITPPANLDRRCPVFYWNGYVYYGSQLNKVPYSNLTATPESANARNNQTGIGGHIVANTGSTFADITNLADGKKLSFGGLFTNYYIRTANHRITCQNSVYDENLNLVQTNRGSGFPLPNNNQVYIDVNQNVQRLVINGVSASTNIALSGGIPSTSQAQLLDYRLFTFLETGASSNVSTGAFGYYDLQNAESSGTATFVKLFDCYAGDNASSHIQITISEDHSKVVVMDTQYGVTIIHSDGSYTTYTDIAHVEGYAAYLVGDIIFSNGNAYTIASDASMGATSSKNHQYLGICKNDVSAGQTGTAIVLFS